MKSDVYFVKAQSRDEAKRLSALKRLLEKTDPFSCYKKREIVPLKLTIGDSGCVYNINPEMVKLVVGEMKKKAAKPFLFDTSVIYKGARQNAVDHLNLAESKGYGQARIGSPFIIADGVLGQDGKEYNVDSSYIDKIKIPSFIGMLDSLTVLSHATGHIVSRYAGAIKNIAMGMVCQSTKQVEHSALKPGVIEKKCAACGCCVAICPVKAVSFVKEKAYIDQRLCIGCGECLAACKFDAVLVNWEEDPDIFCKRMADVAKFILSRFKNKFFINFVFDVTKECDCISDKNDILVAEDIGILASTDILSIDKATMDMIGKHKKTDYFGGAPAIYGAMFEYATARSIGNIEYNLIEI